ncbi:hypothetical protein BDV33DRAFT_193663 [Aspergillus novoparasiticus]|uniref:F-box domain-containing protein n=1 Tax=Aspergillus novoparasiticus TaxID=986946 RepID=A0A5N6EJN7_9EURO|nr:hypothetical protein BDV33DRAFT_193663 [Aspergillus novoparasiticus]
MATLMPRGYRSATEFRFHKEQTDAIIRTTAYHRKDYYQSVICGLRVLRLSSLDRLPLELLFDTLCRLDMLSLFKFRQVNFRSRQMVDSLSQYHRVVSHGLNLFCALLRTRTAVDITLLDFYTALCSKTCTFCGEFGVYICIVTWKRCCFKCLQVSPETQIRTLASSLPGIYSMNESVQKPRIAIVSLHQATLVCRRQSHALPQVQPASSDRNQKFNFMGSCALPYYDKQTGRVEHGISCAGCQLAVEKDIIGTRGTKWGYEARDKVYAQDGFLDHFRWV